jgi:hypothetical protein
MLSYSAGGPGFHFKKKIQMSISLLVRKNKNSWDFKTSICVGGKAN